MTVVPEPVSPVSPELPLDYLEKVYAGVLGKLIGVYLGRPFEGWTYERITAELGEIEYYVHDRLGLPLVVTDDDITGTFTFLRALEEQQCSPAFTSEDVGQTWLNAVLEQRTLFWWGGYGMSTEHTAYLNLKNGLPAPASGSADQNGQTVAEQIGAQIFIDGWAMVAPGQPTVAASFAERAARVSHDGEAVYAAQVIAAMESRAFTTSQIPVLLDTALSVIPADCLVARLILDLRGFHAREPDWRRARAFIAERYGYDRYPGNCHVIPNHALIIMALLYGAGDFQQSMLIVNTSGWDTDCNAGNLGCLLGIMNGLDGLESGPDWRAPVADRLYLPTADGGRAITDAAREAVWVTNLGRALQGQPALTFKNGARFHFELPGSVQGFQAAPDLSTPDMTTLRNVAGHSRLGSRSLEIRYRGLSLGRSGRVATPTFSPQEMLRFASSSPYDMIASPTLYPGQRLTASVEADVTNTSPVCVALTIEVYGAHDQPARHSGPVHVLTPGQTASLEWTVPDTGGHPICSVGLELRSSDGRRANGAVYLDALGWSGAPTTTFTRPADGSTLWRQAWVNAVDLNDNTRGGALCLIQNRGRGLIAQGTQEWTDYAAEATLIPHLSTTCGLGIRVQGMRRYYALLFVAGAVQLVKMTGHEQVLATAPFAWRFGQPYRVVLEASGARLRGWIDGQLYFDMPDEHDPLKGGGVALLVEQGLLDCDAVSVRPAEAQ